ncbi:hypothetical protein A3Q56_00335 [Intoshia linei]|uniref:Cytochrome b5 heme-binding domain-containing protein n=1 Tax=Intoshia linei TaxID=1819745 RepID=A0A177BC60_9BILA|nr:hypothetical protein A3Q56_00335 [Intoshia linei]
MSPLKLPKSKISSSFREKQFSLLHWNKHMEKYQGIEDNSKIINHVEMAKHNNFQDAWISIQGIIYDVTEFLNYHPSGEDELMRVAGLDGTFFFNHKTIVSVGIVVTSGINII